MVLGIVMGTMLEQAFVTSLKSDGSIMPFLDRPISAILAVCTIAAFAWPALVWIKRKMEQRTAVAAE
jgi:putative tricarboxylic transport membrane protein